MFRPGRVSVAALLSAAAVSTDADALIADYDDGIAVSADDGSGNFTYSVKDSGTPANDVSNGDPQTVFTNGTTSAKLSLQSDGTYKWSPHTHFATNLGTAAWSLQNTATKSGTELGCGVTSSPPHVRIVNRPYAGGLYTIDLEMKSGTHDYGFVAVTMTSLDSVGMLLDLANGTILETHTNNTGTIEATSATDMGDGWTRFTITYYNSDGTTTTDSRPQLGLAEDATPPSWNTGSVPQYSGSTAGTETINMRNMSYYRGAVVDADDIIISGDSFNVWGTATDYDTDESEYSVLCELSVTNRVTDNVDTSGMTTQFASLTQDAATAPDGTTTATRLTDNSSVNVNHRAYIAYTGDASAQAVASVYCKAETLDHMCFSIIGSSPRRAIASYNLSDGSVRATYENTYTIQDTGTESIGNGWYRCWIKFTSDGTAPSFFQVAGDDGTSTLTINGCEYTGSLESFLFWGGQEEAGDLLSSPILTYGATVTRDQDEVYWDTGQTYAEPVSGVVKVKWLEEPATTASPFFGFTNDTSPRDALELRTDSGDVDFLARESDTADIFVQDILSTTGITSSTHIFAMAADDNDGSVSVDGGAVNTDATGLLTWNVSQLSLNNVLSGGTPYISPMRFYYAFVVPERIADGTLVTLATA